MSRAKFDAIQAAYVKVQERRSTFADAIYRKYQWSIPTWQLTRAERDKKDKIDAAESKCLDRMSALLADISPRSWSASVPYHWLCTGLTYADAITTGQLSVMPPVPYGHTAYDVERFAAPLESCHA